MAENKDVTAELQRLVDARAGLESQIRNSGEELSPEAIADYDRSFANLQRGLIRLFRRADSEEARIAITLEMARIMENELVYLQNFIIEPSTENQVLAGLVSDVLADLGARRAVLSPLENTYYRGVAALYAGNLERARSSFSEACESEESDETNDIKYKSFVILGNLSHEARDYGQAKELHERSVRYSHNENVTAQALALKALNSYALRDYDEALGLFDKALTLFRRGEPFFNSYFYRNALLFSGAIHVDRKEYDRAEPFYRRVADAAQPSSYDQFEALSQLGKICFRTGRFDEAAEALSKAVDAHGAGENESLVDTCYWLARAHLKNNAPERARPMLERVAASDVRYGRRSQAVELLRQVV